MDRSVPKNVLFDFFEGRGTSLQRKLIEEWLAVPGNDLLFFQWLNEWEGTHPEYLPDTGKALENYKALLQGEITGFRTVKTQSGGAQHYKALLHGETAEPSPTPMQRTVPDRNPRTIRRRWFAAASVIVLVGMAALFFQRDIRYRNFQTGYAVTKNVRLEDGTEVTLNSNSNLYVPRWGFGRSHREVLLEGEAEFVVSHTDDHKRFVVKTADDFEVEVLGTEFVMFARQRGKKVTLSKGSVKVHYEQGKELALEPGQMVSFDARAKAPRLEKIRDPQVQSAWKNRQLYFDDTSLSEVAEVIRDHFGVEVVLADTTLGQRRLSGYFSAVTPEEIGQAISVLLNIEIRQSAEKLIIQNSQSKEHE